MREELVRVLNYKLDDINGDIEALVNLNNKIDEEKEKSSFIAGILDTFKENESTNPLNLVNISKEDFERVLDIAGSEVKSIFETSSCNYDGLVYLINGINNGVSLSLTDEQKNGIEYLIKTLSDKKKEFDSAVDGYTLVKSRYEVNDVDTLRETKDEYAKIISGLDRRDYVKDTNLLTEAIKFSALSPDETISLLTYVLEYNADVYKEGRPVYEEPKEEKVEEEVPEETYEEPKEEEVPEEEPKDEFKLEDEFHFNNIESDNLFDLPNITFDEDNKEPEETYEEPKEEEIPQEEEKQEEPEEDDYQEFKPYVENPEPEDVQIPDELTYVPAVDEAITTSPIEDNVSLDIPEESEASKFEPKIDFGDEPKEEPVEIDNDFKDVISGNEDYEEREVQEEEKTSTRELQKIFSKYGIEENSVLNELIDGNVTEYQNILDSLKDSGVLEYFRKNRELLIETLLYSNTDVIDSVLKIVKEDLSVDDEDYGITLKIVINTIPSIFVKDGGNYDNFIKNVSLFKELGINLINLFDFSKEIFVANNANLKKNVDIINKYGFDITYKNAKYFLLIPNIADKIDYYVESVYEDKTKGETFDGIDYIRDYTAKLNVVTDETIRRLRYASENNKKVFGSKHGSLSGEITNLKVNALDIGVDYASKFFNNEFSHLTGDEVREYIKLIHNSSNVGNYSDELDMLNNYHDGLRYNIEGVRVSYNKVVRNYNILRSYGISSKKALQFAVCYNLIITKEEYDKLNDLLDKIGGNV